MLGVALLDLREALDRLYLGPENGSRPSGSLASCERGPSGKTGEYGGGRKRRCAPAPVGRRSAPLDAKRQGSAEARYAPQ